MLFFIDFLGGRQYSGEKINTFSLKTSRNLRGLFSAHFLR